MTGSLMDLHSFPEQFFCRLLHLNDGYQTEENQIHTEFGCMLDIGREIINMLDIIYHTIVNYASTPDCYFPGRELSYKIIKLAILNDLCIPYLNRSDHLA